MIVFWTLAGLATALAGLLVLSLARRGADRAEPVASTATAEMAELDRLKARGLLDEEAWVAARAEAGRRLLAGTPVDAAPRTGARDRTVVMGALIAAAAATLGLYFVIGDPGLPDQAYERRIDAWAESPEALEPAQIAAVLGRVAREEPDNRMALTMLGAARFEAGDALGAASAFRRVLALDPNDATSWARLGESLVRAADGSVGLDAEAAFVRALELDPDQLGARYFLGDAALGRGDTAKARELWGPLIAALEPADPRRVELVQRLDAAA